MVDELKDYRDCYGCLKLLYPQVNGYDFYRFIFPNNQVQGEHQDSESQGYKPNAVYLYKPCIAGRLEDDDPRRRLRRRIMLSDTWEEDYTKFVERNDFTLCSGLSYRGKANTLNNAQLMNALVFDLDGVGLPELMTLLHRFDMSPTMIRTLPRPTFLVLSGTGVHLYYVFEEPIDLYPNIKSQFKQFKHELTFRMWEYTQTSKQESIQQQSIAQGFRMVGSINNKHGNEIVAFQTGKRVTLEYMNSYLQLEGVKVDITKKYKSTMTREQAKKKYPNWYQKVIINGEKSKGRWTVKKDLYNWWLRQSKKVTGGHRYFYLMCLVIYAIKCSVSKEEVKADMLKTFDELKNIGHENPLTLEDVESALKIYEKELYNFTIDDIEKLTGIRIERNKRNGRKQADHLKMARYIRDEINGKRDTWRENNGRKEKFLDVLDFLVQQKKNQHLGMDKKLCKITKYECAKVTGLDKKTVRKHYDLALKLCDLDFDVLRMIDIDDISKVKKETFDFLRDAITNRYSSMPESESKDDKIKFDLYHELIKVVYFNS